MEQTGDAIYDVLRSIATLPFPIDYSFTNNISGLYSKWIVSK